MAFSETCAELNADMGPNGDTRLLTTTVAPLLLLSDDSGIATVAPIVATRQCNLDCSGASSTAVASSVVFALLLAELVLVLRLPKAQGGPMLWKLVIAAVAMIALGYPGEISTDTTTRMIWGTLSSIPFAYILYVLWVQLGAALPSQPEPVQHMVKNIRLLTLATWGFYPITYCLPYFGIDPSSSEVGIQLGYAISDILAKCGYGFMIYNIARLKTEADNAAAA